MSEADTQDYGMDEVAVQSFEVVGFKHPFPPELVSTYRKFKLVRDRLTPGRLSPDGYAAVVLLTELVQKAGAARKPGKQEKEPEAGAEG